MLGQKDKKLANIVRAPVKLFVKVTSTMGAT